MAERKERSCAKCGITSKGDPSLTFHRFPVATERNSLKARVWAIFCYPNEDWTSYHSVHTLHKKHKMLCGKHFDISSFTGIDRRKLNNFAIPTEAQHILTELRQEMIESPDAAITHEYPGAPSTPQSVQSTELTIECTPWSQNVDIMRESTISQNSDEELFLLLCNQQESQRKHSTSKLSDRNAGTKSVDTDILPEIPQFSGKFWDWPTFKDKYISLIHSSNISEIDKFHCLLSSVKGNALRMIKKLQFTAENYEIAWQLLLNKYDNHRRRINNLMNELLNFPIIKKESSRHLKSLVHNIKTSIYALKRLGQPTDHWDTILIHLMLRKLDSVTFREWENQCNTLTALPNLKQFLDFISNKADTLEISPTEDKRNSRRKMKLLKKDISPIQV